MINKATGFWGEYFDMNEQVYKQFPKEGLNIPYPQMDVHPHKEQQLLAIKRGINLPHILT